MCVSLSKWFSPFIFINKDDPYSIWRFIFKNHFYKVKDLSRRLKIERSISVTASCLNCTKSCSYYIYIYTLLAVSSQIAFVPPVSALISPYSTTRRWYVFSSIFTVLRFFIFIFHVFLSVFFLGDNILFHPFSNLVDNWISSV